MVFSAVVLPEPEPPTSGDESAGRNLHGDFVERPRFADERLGDLIEAQ